MDYFCNMQLKLVSRFFIPVFILMLIGYFHLGLGTFQGEGLQQPDKQIENQEQLKFRLAQNEHHLHSIVKPTTKGKTRKRGKAVICVSENQEEDSDDDERNDDKQDSLTKYVKHAGYAAVFYTTALAPSTNSGYFPHPNEPLTRSVSDKNILFQVFRI